MLKSPNITSDQWHGEIKLTYEKRRNTTQAIETYARSPFKLQRPFYPQGGETCYSTIVHTAGGMVGGDRLSQLIGLKPQTHAVITNAAASKIYGSNGKTAVGEIKIEVGENSCLEYLPREMIVFDGAKYQQNLIVKLAPTATWLSWEIVRFGRSARGEQFLQGNWRSATEVWQDHSLVWVDRSQLLGGKEIWESPHSLGGQPIIGTLVWLGKPIPSEIMTQVRNLFPHPSPTGEGGSTQLMSGLLCRYRGNQRSEVIHWFINIWHLLRQWERKKTPILPRVWRV